MNPLAGKRVLVTRSRHQAGKLSQELELRGAIPVEVPVLEIGPPEDWAPLDQALRSFSSFDWLILTSANTVDALVERARVLGIPWLQPEGMRIAAVGRATAEAARKTNLLLTIVPEAYVAESLLDAMLPKLEKRARILIARAAQARDVIPQALRQAGFTVEVVDAYRNRLPVDAAEQLKASLLDRIDMIPFTSSSSVLHLREAAERAGLSWPLPGIPAVSIGPITTQTLVEQQWPPAAEASPSDIPGLIAAAERLFA